MSKVYSFRLSDNNPREAQAREVIETWVKEGYSLRQVVVEALLAYRKDEIELDGFQSILAQIQELISTQQNQQDLSPIGEGLAPSFMDSVKQSAKLGISVE